MPKRITTTDGVQVIVAHGCTSAGDPVISILEKAEHGWDLALELSGSDAEQLATRIITSCRALDEPERVAERDMLKKRHAEDPPRE